MWPNMADRNNGTSSHTKKPSISEFDPLAELVASTSSSSSKAPVFHTPVPSSPVQVHSRRFSSGRGISNVASPTSPEFGSFVQASAVDDDPLLGAMDSLIDAPPNLDKEHSALTAASKNEFDRFAEEAKARNESNERRLLDELRKHDSDPLSWLGKSDSNKADEEEKRGLEDEGSTSNLISALREAGSTPIDLTTPRTEDAPFSTTPKSEHVHDQPSLARATSDTSLHDTRSRAPSHLTPSSPLSTSSLGTSFARGWMSTLLSSSHAASASSSPSSVLGSHSPDAPSPQPEGALSTSPTQSRLQALFSRTSTQPLSSARTPSPSSMRHARFMTDGHLPTHAATLPVSLPSGIPTASALAAPGSSPFASHAYIPPSGAPGFAGDRNWNTSGFEFDESKSMRTSVSLQGRRAPTTPVLDVSLADSLRSHLPALARLPNSWTLLYSTDQDGFSLNTLYARCTPQQVVGGGGKLAGLAPSGALVAIQDAEGGVFGAWVGEGVHLSHGSYYGGGDSFLWRVDPHDNNDLRVYKWTGRNDYVALCDKDGFSFGGGEGHYGLYVDESLVQGTTHSCPTFDNDCLAQGSRHGRMVSFDCVGLEIWGIGP